MARISTTNGPSSPEEKKPVQDALVSQSHETWRTSNLTDETSVQNKDEVMGLETAWKDALGELNNQLVRYNRIGREPGQAIEENKQAAEVVLAMHKVASAHTDPKVKEEYMKKAEKFERASPKERRKEMNALLKGVLILLSAPFILAGAAIFAAGSILYGVGSIVKGLGNLVTGGLWKTLEENVKKNASGSDQEE